MEKSGRPLTKEWNPSLGLAGARTDEVGEFEMAVPPGTYKVMAQKWIDPAHRWDSGMPWLPPLPREYGETVALYGTAQGIDVPSSEAMQLTLAPEGTGTVVLDLDFPNNEALLVASRGPVCADPVLRFTGWQGEFLREAIGLNRMPEGRTTIRQVPEGELHLAVFANDNLPGFGRTRATVRSDEMTSATMEIVAPWSNARHTPPQKLRPLYDKVQQNGWALEELINLEQTGLDQRNLFEGPAIPLDQLGDPESPVRLPDGKRVKMIDLLSVYGYRKLIR